MYIIANRRITEMSGRKLPTRSVELRHSLATDTSDEFRLPLFMLPPVNGVLPFRNVTCSQNEIVAKATLNFLNRPKIVLDRITG